MSIIYFNQSDVKKFSKDKTKLMQLIDQFYNFGSINEDVKKQKYDELIKLIIKKNIKPYTNKISKHPDHMTIQELDEDNNDNSEWVINSIIKDPSGLKKLSIYYKNNIKFLTEIILYNHEVYEFIDSNLKEDKDFNIQLVYKNAVIYEYLNDNLKKDDDIIKSAIRGDPDLFKIAPKRLKNDYEIALYSIKQKPELIKYASLGLQVNIDLILEVIKEQPSIYEYLNYEMKNYRKIILSTVKMGNLDPIEIADKSTLKDKKVFMEAIKHLPSAYKFAHKSIQKELKVVPFKKKYQFTLEERDPFMIDDGSIRSSISKFLGKKPRKLNKNYIYTIINNSFSQFQFSNEIQNQYYKKPNKLPKYGFPTLIDRFEDDLEELDYQIHPQGISIKRNGFITGDYTKLCIFLSSILLTLDILKYEFNLPKKKFFGLSKSPKFDEKDQKIFSDILIKFFYQESFNKYSKRNEIKNNWQTNEPFMKYFNSYLNKEAINLTFKREESSDGDSYLWPNTTHVHHLIFEKK